MSKAPLPLTHALSIIPSPCTPLHHSLLASLLASHPSPAWAIYLLEGLTQGFRIGYWGNNLARTAPNLQSALAHVIQNYLTAECQAGHTAGPSPHSPPSSPTHWVLCQRRGLANGASSCTSPSGGRHPPCRGMAALSFSSQVGPPSPDLQLYTDSSGTIGFGAYCQGSWFNGRWSQEQHRIQWKEQYPIVQATCAWGHR